MFVHEGELAPLAAALPLCMLCSSVPLLPSLIKQTSMKQMHTADFISCCYRSSSNLLFPNKLIQKHKKCLPKAFIIESNILNQINFPSQVCKEKNKQQHQRMILSYSKCWPNIYFHSFGFVFGVSYSLTKFN